MGNNSAFSQFEAVVLACYNRDVLSLDLLREISAAFEDSDADSGGYSGDLAKDGLDLYQIVAKTAGRELPPKGTGEDTDDYWDACSEIFREVTGL